VFNRQKIILIGERKKNVFPCTEHFNSGFGFKTSYCVKVVIISLLPQKNKEDIFATKSAHPPIEVWLS
jgi:hypothetical protein